MAVFTNGFDAYQIFYYSKYSTPPPPFFEAIIQVYQGGVFVGRIAFYPDSGPIPANATIAPLGAPVPSIHYALSRFDDVIEILRQEKPLYLYLDTTSGIGIIATTDKEPVGEQEGV